MDPNSYSNIHACQSHSLPANNKMQGKIVFTRKKVRNFNKFKTSAILLLPRNEKFSRYRLRKMNPLRRSRIAAKAKTSFRLKARDSPIPYAQMKRGVFSEHLKRGLLFTRHVVESAMKITKIMKIPNDLNLSEAHMCLDGLDTTRSKIKLSDSALCATQKCTRANAPESFLAPYGSSESPLISLPMLRSSLMTPTYSELSTDLICGNIFSKDNLKKMKVHLKTSRGGMRRGLIVSSPFTALGPLKIPIILKQPRRLVGCTSTGLKDEFDIETDRVTSKQRKRDSHIWQDTNANLNDLVLMTFNVGLLEYCLGGITWYSNPPFTWKRLYEITPALRNTYCDIIALQEVYDESQADFLVESLRADFPFVARRTSGGALSLHNGLMVLSKFPLIATAFHPFKAVTTLERIFASKGMLEASLDIPTVGRVTIVNVHLASGAMNPESAEIEKMRNKEIVEILETCKDIKNRGEIPLILGDLNTAPNLCPSNYRKLMEAGWRDAYVLGLAHTRRPKGFYSEFLRSHYQNHRKNWALNSKILFWKRYSLVTPLELLYSATYQDCLDKPESASIHLKPSSSGSTSKEVRNLRLSSESASSSKQPESLSKAKDALSQLERSSNIEPENLIIHSNNQISSAQVKLTKDSKVLAPLLQRLLSKLKIPTLALTSTEIARMAKVSSFKTLADEFRGRRRRSSLYRYSALPTMAEKVASLVKNASFTSTFDDIKASTYFDMSDLLRNDPLRSQDFTWDPRNPLNVIGPHSDCHGLRCDHLFLPPVDEAGELGKFSPSKSVIMFRNPIVSVEGWCCGLLGETSRVTLSDHYAVCVTLCRAD